MTTNDAVEHLSIAVVVDPERRDELAQFEADVPLDPTTCWSHTAERSTYGGPVPPSVTATPRGNWSTRGIGSIRVR